MSTAATIDETVFAELCDATGADFVAELVETFAEELPGMLDELRNAMGAASAERFRRAAHSLKANALSFGALPLAELARRLETSGLPSDSVPIDDLDRACMLALASLRGLAHG